MNHYNVANHYHSQLRYSHLSLFAVAVFLMLSNDNFSKLVDRNQILKVLRIFRFENSNLNISLAPTTGDFRLHQLVPIRTGNMVPKLF